MTDWKKKLNLNSYEWWRNHRRVVTFGGFLLLFAWYINPVIQVHRNKITCAEFYSPYGNLSGKWKTARRRTGTKKVTPMYCEYFK